MSDLFARPLPMGEFFDRVADQYDEVHTSHIDGGEAFYEAIAEPVTPTADPVEVLSLGAGTGLDLVGLVERAPNARLDCIDLSAKMLEKLVSRFAGTAATVTTRLASFPDFDYGDHAYDYVLAAASLHHFTDDEKRGLYPRLAGALRDGGKLIIGDYYVSEAEAEVRLAEYQRGMAQGYDFRLGQYHMDIPTSRANETTLLMQAGFTDVATIWESSNYAILVVTRS